jgi:hypothetical protein
MIPKPFQNNFDDNLFSLRKRDNLYSLFLANIYVYDTIRSFPTKQIKTYEI